MSSSRMRGVVLGWMLAVATASLAHARPVTRHEPITVTGRNLASLTFARLVVRAEAAADLGIAKEEYILDFIDELRARGYPVLGAENLVFAKDESAKAPFSLGGTLTELRCSNEDSRVCGVVIQWQLLDRRLDRVVYEVEVRHEERDMPAHFDKQAGKALLLGALRSLLSRERFVQALERPPAVEQDARRYPRKTIERCMSPSLSLPRDIEQTLAASVLIKAGDAVGSGFLVSPDGLVLTAAHVVGQRDVNVTMRDGTQYAGRTVRLDAKHDVALVQLATRQTTCVALRATPAEVGEEVYAVGAPTGAALSFSVSRGIVSARREIEGESFLQTDATLNPGNSGGPLLDAQGQAMAIVSWKLSGSDLSGLGFGVPVSSALQHLALSQGDQTDPELGAQLPLPPPPPPAPIVDTPDAPYKAIDRPTPRLSGWVWPVRAASYAVLGGGAAAIVYSYTTFKDEKAHQHKTYEQMRPLNDAGWVAVGLGAVGLTCSYAFRTYRPEERNSARLSGGLGPGFATLRADF